jgi:small subunit ribosomal protein S20
MPITKSAKKALRQNIKRRARNLVYKNKIKGLLKEIRSLVSQGKTEEAKNSCQIFTKSWIRRQKEE